MQVLPAQAEELCHRLVLPVGAAPIDIDEFKLLEQVLLAGGGLVLALLLQLFPVLLVFESP